MRRFAVLGTCIVVAFLSVPLTARPATPQARKDAQVKAFFKAHPRLSKTTAGQLALLRIEVRRLGAQVRSLSSARALERRAEWDADAARQFGWTLAQQIGWSRGEFDCIDSLWGRYESSWRVHADNPGSDAYGIPQALPGSKMGVGWETSARTQILWGYGYVSKYGGPCGALSHRLSYGSY